MSDTKKRPKPADPKVSQEPQAKQSSAPKLTHWSPIRQFVYLLPVMLPLFLIAAIAAATWLVEQRFKELRTTIPDKLEQRFEALRAKIDKPPPPPDERGLEEMKNLKKQNDTIISELREAREKLMQKMDSQWSSFEKALNERLSPRNPGQKPGSEGGMSRLEPKAKPKNVLIAVLHSNRVRYSGDCRRVLLDYCNEFYSPTHRVAVVLFRGAEERLLLDFQENPPDPKELAQKLNFDGKLEGDELPGLAVGEFLHQRMAKAPPGAANQVILIASTDCPPPSSLTTDEKTRGPSWDGLEKNQVRVDTLLIPSRAKDQPKQDIGPQSPSALAEWSRFCGKNQGVCLALWRLSDPEKMDRLLFQRLMLVTEVALNQSRGTKS